MTAAAADTSQADALLCPLCEYDLRGLTDPRCPECGYAFTWDEITDPARRLHPYAFEHHAERNAWSFRRTLLGGLRPGRFWRTLFPTQPSRPRRLVTYWLIASCFALLPMLAQYVRHAVAFQREAQAWRMRAATWPPAQFNSYAPWVVANYGSAQAFFDEQYPLWPSPRAALMTFRHSSYDWATQWAAVVLIAWPWLTFAALMIFQVSMRRVRIRPIHVLRCVLYTSDIAIWFGLIVLLVIAAEAYRLGLPPRGWGWGFGFTGLAAVGVVAAAMLLFTVRLAFAYRLYLRFTHATAAALASQVIVGLIVFKLFLDWEFIRRLWW